ncbi:MULTISPECIES: proton-conducting transporter membrane subunit [unclassified Methylocaldum]|jgi:multicomponent Na+:H+ antiporter subunit D|uniref:complex I subunit 5 family protein n=2 Tax=Methylocaldum TaxID=73778 RepID=UPI000A328E1F|nr:proton-conducting transporter membrane subunit [Methylocaldum sp. RMAD-M]MBP1152064.1 formate hydrogenlyase subunit 3/multisubunit Na+/H+ antiporter MnhD subunit [Methylocaldum sp. RMAD-M]
MSGISFAAPWIPLLILLPLMAGALSFLFGPRGHRSLLAATMTGIWFSLIRLILEFENAGLQHYPIGGWGAPLGIDLRADGLSLAMLGMTATVGSFISLYALGYFAGDENRGIRFWPLWWLLWGALNAVFLSADLFNLYVTLELLSLSAVGLVVLAGDRDSLAAGLRYLLAALAGSLAYLMGVALLYGAYGTLSLERMAGLFRPEPANTLAASLITVGLMLKTALFPLHFWLPPAHGSALAPVSALLSGLVIKASFYMLLRLWFEVFPSALTEVFTQGIGSLGAIAVFAGAWLAFHQEKLKMLIAWSTVTQVGYLFLTFPLAAASSTSAPAALSGGVYLAVSHAVAKAAVFLAAGAMLKVTDEDRIDRLEGVGRHLPISLFAFAMAGVSLMGLPPSGGFIAKWLLLNAALSSGQWWWAAVLVLGGLASAAYIFRVLRRCFLPPREYAAFHPVPLVMPLAALSLAGIALALGLAAAYPLRLLQTGAPLLLEASAPSTVAP